MDHGVLLCKQRALDLHDYSPGQTHAGSERRRFARDATAVPSSAATSRCSVWSVAAITWRKLASAPPRFALHRRVRRSCVASYAPARAMRGASIEVDRRRPVAQLRVLARAAALARAVAAAEQ